MSDVAKTPITVAYGDGIGPEIMKASLRVMEAAGAALDIQTIEIGEQVYLRGHSSGIEESAWDSLRRTKVFFKSPITTPQGGGYKSLNVTVRKTLGMFANVRPCVAYAPFVPTNHPGMDLIVVRENEEDLYAGIEYQQTDDVTESMKIISRPGSERIVRYAFNLARSQGRKKVTCMTKDNIMKISDGLFHRCFKDIGPIYREIEQDHFIIDIGMARVATRPERFDVIVLPNLYGDILSDVTAETTGSVGLGPSANIGPHCSMFEAIHGSAPDIAGRGIANPSGLLLAGVMMLVHIGQNKIAEKVHNAWLKTIEDGIHTGDIYHAGRSTQKVGTQDFAEAVIQRLGQSPSKLRSVSYPETEARVAIGTIEHHPPQKKEIVGVDIYLHSRLTTDEIAVKMTAAECEGMVCNLITNRGVKVWPDGMAETFTSDHWRCRYMCESTVSHQQIVTLLNKIIEQDLDFIKVEQLCKFNGEIAFSMGQGQ